MLSGGLMAAADASWDVEVSCQTMWEAFGPTFSPGSTTSSGAAYSFGWESECCPCADSEKVDPVLGMTSKEYCSNAGFPDGPWDATCSERMVTINQKHLYHVLNPTGATVDIGSDIVVTNRSEYLPNGDRGTRNNGLIVTDPDTGATGGLVQINVGTNTSVDLRMRTKPSCCLDLASNGDIEPCEWWEAAPFDEGAFATLKTEVEGSSKQEIVDFKRTDGATLADLQNAMDTSVLLCIDFFLNRDPRKGCTLEQAFTDALAQPEDWEFTSWDEGRSWEEAGCALPLPKGHRVCRHNPDTPRFAPPRFAPRSELANKMQAKLYKCPLKETHQTLPNVLASISVYDFDDNRQTKEGTDTPSRETFQINGYVAYKFVQPMQDMQGIAYADPLDTSDNAYHPSLRGFQLWRNVDYTMAMYVPGVMDKSNDDAMMRLAVLLACRLASAEYYWLGGDVMPSRRLRKIEGEEETEIFVDCTLYPPSPPPSPPLILIPVVGEALTTEGVSWDIVGILIGLAALFLCCLLLLLLFFCCRGQQTEKLYVYQVPDLPVRPVDAFRG